MYEVFLIEQTFFEKIGIIYTPRSLYFNPLDKIKPSGLKIIQNKVNFRVFSI